MGFEGTFAGKNGELFNGITVENGLRSLSKAQYRFFIPCCFQMII